MAEIKVGIGPIAMDKCDTLVLELTNESAFFQAMSVLIRDRRHKNKWVGKALVSNLVKTTMKTVRTITRVPRITPAMMEYIYQALMREYQEDMDDIDKEKVKIIGKGADFLIVDDFMAEDLPLNTDGKFTHGHSGPSSRSIGMTKGVSAVYRTTDNIPRHAGSFHDEEIFIKAGNEIPRSWHDHVAKVTGKTRNQVKTEFYALMYGADSATLNKLNKINGETQMNFNQKPFENVNYDLIYGCKPKDLTENQLLEAIKHLEDEISTLEDIKAESVAKDKRIQGKRDSIDQIVKELDSRITKETK